MFLIGKKLNMTQIWNDKEQVQVVTRIQCKDCKVAQVKTEEKDGYAAAVVSDGKTSKEVRSEIAKSWKQGDEFKVAELKVGDKVKVVGTSKGKGFQGVVKRHGFAGGGASHGHRHDLRQPGSIGSAFPQHVMKGKKMAGRMGFDRVTVKNLTIVGVEDGGVVLIKGAVPGTKGSRILIMGS